jgi:hypothetical protein
MGALAQDVRGSLNGTVFSRNLGGAYVRSKVSPVQPVSGWSSAARQGFKAVSQRWANVLLDAQRSAWSAFAAVHPFVNVFGDSLTLSGVAMYQAVNQRVRLCGGGWIDDAPLTFVVGDLGTVTIVATATGGTYATCSVVAENALPYGGGLYVEMTVQIPPGRVVQKNDYRLVNQANRVVFASGVDFAADANLRFPLSGVAAGNLIGFRVAAIDLSTGAIGPGVSARVTLG